MTDLQLAQKTYRNFLPKAKIAGNVIGPLYNNIRINNLTKLRRILKLER